MNRRMMREALELALRALDAEDDDEVSRGRASRSRPREKRPDNIDRLPSGKLRVRIEHQGRVASVVRNMSVPEAVEVRDALKREIADGAYIPKEGASLKDIGPQFLASRLQRSGYGTDES